MMAWLRRLILVGSIALAACGTPATPDRAEGRRIEAQFNRCVDRVPVAQAAEGKSMRVLVARCLRHANVRLRAAGFKPISLREVMP